MLTLLCTLFFSFANAGQGQWNIPITGQIRVFPNIPQYRSQSYNNHSVAIKPKYQYSFDNDNGDFNFEPFYRYDDVDEKRTHGDIREFSYTRSVGSTILKFGISKVFWGVTETQHLVDIVNQYDFVDSTDSTEKLGQPMLHLFWPSSFGNWDAFILFGFRPRTFPGIAGRLRSPWPVNPNLNERIKSSDIDYAMRWSKQIERLDIGLSFFTGNSRDPILRPNNLNTTLASSMIATYDDITQLGLDAQLTMDKFILKAEAISRDGYGSPVISQYYKTNPNDYYAFTVGGELSLESIRGTDVGLIFEYSYDQRQPQPISTTLPVFAIFQNDYFLGIRWILNDAYESNLFAGASVDADTKASTITLRFNRRIYENLSLNLRTLTLVNIPDPNADPYASVQNDSHFEINLTQYFLF